MNCRTCGYALWNLPSNVCPECGTTFDLRSYQFEPGTVEFACPYCDHRYAGQGRHYLPTEAQSMTCVQCGQDVPAQKFRAIPLRPDAVAVDPQSVPWESRQTRGFWRAWWETWKLTCFNPTALGKQLGTGQPWWGALGFAAITHGLSSLVGLSLAIVVVLVDFAQNGAMTWSNLTMFVGWFIMIVLLLLTVMVAHLVVRITGKHHGDWHVTARAICYSQGPMLWSALPLCGCVPFLGWIWSLVSGTMMLRESQRISTGRACAAVMTLSVVTFVATIALFAAIIAMF